MSSLGCSWSLYKNDADRIIQRSIPEPNSGCWLWDRKLTVYGYGVVERSRAGKRVRRDMAHRVSYEAFVWPIPAGLDIDHLCRVRHCVNPTHLEVVTRQVNLLRGIGHTAKNAAKTECPRGHEYTPENTLRSRSGSRECRKCKYASNKARRLRASSSLAPSLSYPKPVYPSNQLSAPVSQHQLILAEAVQALPDPVLPRIPPQVE